MKQRDLTYTPMTMAEIYAEMHDRGLVKNKSEFSMAWLGRTSGYFYMLGEKVSVETCFILWDNLLMSDQHDLAHQVMIRIRAMVRFDMYGTDEVIEQRQRIKTAHDALIDELDVPEPPLSTFENRQVVRRQKAEKIIQQAEKSLK